jgi:hypothetical protein
MGGDQEIIQNSSAEASWKWLNGWLRMKKEDNIKLNLGQKL